MARDVMRTKKIARLGEGLLQTLCDEAGLTISRPEHDENGWDRIVEFPQNRLPGVFLDAQPSPLKCLVQVKATDNFSKRKVDMLVSNFEHLARTPLPTFVFCVDFRKKEKPQSAFISHFDQAWIGSTLRRIRELQAEGKEVLHRHEMTFEAGINDALVNLDGAMLKKMIIVAAGIDASAYAKWKMDILENIGFGETRHVISMKFLAKPKDFAGALIGLNDISIEGGKVYSRRFDIDLLEKELVAGIVSIQPPSAGRCSVAATAIGCVPKAVDMNVFMQPVESMPIELRRSRIENDFFQINISNKEGKIKFEISDTKDYDLDEAIANLKFLLNCSEPKSELEFSLGGRVFNRSPIDGRFFVPKPFRSLLVNLTLIREFLDRVGRREKIRVNLGKLRSQDESFKWMQFFLSKRSFTITTKIAEVNSEDPVDARGTFNRPIVFKGSDLEIVAFCFWDMHMKVRNRKLKAALTNPQTWESISMTRDEPAEIARARATAFEAFGKARSNGTLMSTSIEFVDA